MLWVQEPSGLPELEKDRIGITNSIGMELLWVPAGDFVMGSDISEAGDDEEPLTDVSLSAGFFLGKYEVRRSEWEAVMGYDPSSRGCFGPDCPVDRVTWENAQIFIRRLNAKEGTTKYRMPTEAEWEYAARAGTTGERHGPLADIANCGGGGFMASINQSGQKQPNAYGFYDILGNVAEWVADWYGKYPGGSMVDPTGPRDGSLRVARGGRHSSEGIRCRAAARLPIPGEDGLLGVGFRLARTQ